MSNWQWRARQDSNFGQQDRRPFWADSNIASLTSASGFGIEAAERNGAGDNFLQEIRNPIKLCR
jgi:hypothetical protein